MSDSTLQTIEFNYNGNPVRTEIVDDEPLFNVNDLCVALEHTNSRKALKDLVDNEDVTARYTLSNGGKQKANFVTESGMWALILGSRTQAAKNVKRWVTSEVLPAIRRHGSYQRPDAVESAADGSAVIVKPDVPAPLEVTRRSVGVRQVDTVNARELYDAMGIDEVLGIDFDIWLDGVLADPMFTRNMDWVQRNTPRSKRFPGVQTWLSVAMTKVVISRHTTPQARYLQRYYGIHIPPGQVELVDRVQALPLPDGFQVPPRCLPELTWSVRGGGRESLRFMQVEKRVWLHEVDVAKIMGVNSSMTRVWFPGANRCESEVYSPGTGYVHGTFILAEDIVTYGKTWMDGVVRDFCHWINDENLVERALPCEHFRLSLDDEQQRRARLAIQERIGRLHLPQSASEEAFGFMVKGIRAHFDVMMLSDVPMWRFRELLELIRLMDLSELPLVRMTMSDKPPAWMHGIDRRISALEEQMAEVMRYLSRQQEREDIARGAGGDFTAEAVARLLSAVGKGVGHGG